MTIGAGACAVALADQVSTATDDERRRSPPAAIAAAANVSCAALTVGAAGAGAGLLGCPSPQQQALAPAQQHASVCEPRHSATAALGESASSQPAKVNAINFRTSLS
jgi:hypothetical protein